MKRYILIVLVFCLLGCNEGEVGPATDGTVHLAGYLNISDGPFVKDGEYIASYWKDGMYTKLTEDSIYSRVTSLYVDGSSVTIGGWRREPDSPTTTVIWQDGAETIIDRAFDGAIVASRDNNLFGVWLGPTGWEFYKDGTTQPLSDTAYSFGPMAMTLLGDDMYIAGYSSGPALPPNYSPPLHAQYWKNGELIFREPEPSLAFSIFTHQNDIYMAGQIYPTGSIACYWKNGQRVDLTDENESALAKSIFVTDGHVYVSGMINDQAVYWKDGEVTYLTTEGTHSMANSIAVRGTDVHVGGYEHWHPAYWKNDAKQNIAMQDSLGQILFVVVGSN